MLLGSLAQYYELLRSEEITCIPFQRGKGSRRREHPFHGVLCLFLKKMILSILQSDLHLHMFYVFKVIITLVEPRCIL